MTKPKFTFAKTVFIIILIVIWFSLNIPVSKKGYGIDYYNSGLTGCSSAISNITFALEEYNSANPDNYINELNDKNIKILKEKQYLGTSWPFKSYGRKSLVGRNKCKYLTSGDLAKDGIVYCEYHGSINYKDRETKSQYDYILYSEIDYSNGEPNPKHGISMTINLENKNNEAKERSCIYDINKVKIPPSREYNYDERIIPLIKKYHLIQIGIIIAIIVTIFI